MCYEYYVNEDSSTYYKYYADEDNKYYADEDSIGFILCL